MTVDQWARSAAELLQDGDPGAVPFLVEHLVADRSIAVIQGTPKIGKSWLGLDLALSVATGRELFGTFRVCDPGPVLAVVEESGEQALTHRLAVLCHARGISPVELTDFRVAANRRVKLDESDWQERLVEAAIDIGARAVLLDPLVRMKGDGRDEDSQLQMAPVLGFIRELRDKASTTVLFVHHVGHGRARLRGTSDLEAIWESKLSLSGSPDSSLTLSAEHRDAESFAGVRLQLRVSSDAAAFVVQSQGLAVDHAVRSFLGDKPNSTRDEIADGAGKRKSDVLKAIARLLDAGEIAAERKGARGPERLRLVVADLGSVPGGRELREPRFPPSAPLNGRRGEPAKRQVREPQQTTLFESGLARMR